jgi:hypothetical protein
MYKCLGVKHSKMIRGTNKESCRKNFKLLWNKGKLKSFLESGSMYMYSQSTHVYVQSPTHFPKHNIECSL